MKRMLPKTLMTCLFVLLLLPMFSVAQDLTGIWKGYFITEYGESYKLEFQIEQNKANTVTGVSYSWGNNIEFYGKATMNGRYYDDSKSFSIQEIRTVEVKSAGGGTCIMNYKFTYSRSGKEEYLEGTYVGKTENRLDPRRNGQWGDCGGGRVFLRRVTTSEFYVEPFLKNKIVPKTNDSIVNKPVVSSPKTVTPRKKPATPPVTKKTVRTAPAKKPVAKAPVRNPVARTPVKKPATAPIVREVKKDTTHSGNTRSIVNTKPLERPAMNIPTATRSRKNELVQTLAVTSEHVSVRLYDNGEVDDDTISVYLDGKPLLTNQRLSTVPITLKIELDENNPEHTLIMVAENLGRIPPNTSLMIVQDGDKRYQVSITSTEQKNAMVRFRYQKNPG